MNGILIINKPKNFTSHDIVAKVKKMCKQKVGHTGTLDPNATGVLPLLIGKATQVSKYLINHDKEYEAVLKLGVKTDTADAEGNILKNMKVDYKNITEEKIKLLFLKMIGKQKQIPPMYSAIKVNGKKLYEYARSGEKIEVQPREIEIYALELINIDFTNNEIKFKVRCSKGTYIRTLCESIAENLGNIGYMKDLKRTIVGNFKIEDAISIDKLNETNIQNYIIKFEDFFDNVDSINLSQKELQLLLNGVKLTKSELSNGIYKLYNESRFIGTGTIKEGFLKRDIII